MFINLYYFFNFLRGSSRSASIIKFALIEGPTLASIVFYLLTANTVLIGIAGIGIVVMAINHPTAMKVKMDLELSGEI
jgi:hypothetical protein